MKREGKKIVRHPSSSREAEDEESPRREGRARAFDDRAAGGRRAGREAEGEKLRSLGELAAGAAHDINNALTAILGRTQLLLRVARDEEQRRSLHVIETAALDAAATARRIQTFARRAPADPAGPVPLSRLITDALQLTRTRWETDARARGLHYRVNFTPAFEGGDEIAAHPSEVREVLVNLILNALDAMPRGGRLEVEETKAAGAVVVRIKDTGAGVAPELRERIFEPFFTTKGREGSGLGLAVSRSIVLRHGGTIEVESAAGRGTSFTLRFPLSRGGAAAPPPAPPTAAPSRRVLVVDDEDAVREVLVEMLTELGQHVAESSSAAEALKRLSAARFDVLLTDLSMPTTDGLKLAARARKVAPGMTIILMTGYGQSVPGGAPDAALVDLVVNKPFQLSDLEAALGALRAVDRPGP